jgi:hypothetical protein
MNKHTYLLDTLFLLRPKKINLIFELFPHFEYQNSQMPNNFKIFYFLLPFGNPLWPPETFSL